MPHSPPVVEKAPAKLNLYLHVTGRRPNGYHELDSLVVFTEVGDTVSVRPAGELTLTLSGPFAPLLETNEDNLVLRAARSLAIEFGVTQGAALHLEKNLPLASGIGGGSADAAATLRALSRLWDLDCPTQTLDALALSLGADVPVCMAGTPCVMRGIGEVLEPVPELPPAAILLVNPGVQLSTPRVFGERKGDFSKPVSSWPKDLDSETFLTFLADRANDLEDPARRLAPVIGDVLARLNAAKGCHLARMSGSGATCFALFDNEASCGAAAKALRPTGWWVQETTLKTND